MAAMRRRLRSGTVILGGVGTLAAFLTACSSEPDKRCVDRDRYESYRGYKVVSDKECSGPRSGTGKSARRAASDAEWYYDAEVEDGWAKDGHFRDGKGKDTVDRDGFGTSSGSSGG